MSFACLSVYKSQLVDSDKEVALEYYRTLGYGYGIKCYGGGVGSAEFPWFGGGGGHDGGKAYTLVGDCTGEGQADAVGGVGIVGASCVHNNGRSGVSTQGPGADGLADCGFVPSDGNGDCGNGNGTVGSGTGNTDSISDASVPLRGPNYARNCIAREKKKKRKIRKQCRKDELSGSSASVPEVVPEWRRKNEFLETASDRKGYFAECSKSVQVSLRESRAAMLVAKNKKDQAEYERRAKQLGSTEEVMRSVLSALRLSEQLKSIKDAKVGGWVETVADTMVKSVAESVPDSVPSLESVGYGKSALKSSSGSESGVSSERSIEYNIRRRDLEDHYESLEAFNPMDYKEDLNDLKLKFSDVTGVKRPELNAEEITRAAIVAGVDFNGITVMLNSLGIGS